MLEDRRVKIFLLTLVIALTAGIGIKAFVGLKASPVPAPATQEPVQAAQNQEIVVYVTGAVSKPGLVKLPAGARLADALLAVGQTAESDLNNLNLAEKLKDAQKIMVPRLGEQQAANSSTGTSTPNPGSSPSPKSGGKVNINTADAKELDTLPGIGPAMAERIIAYRSEKGPFQRPEDLKDVSGIGDKKYADMADLITVD